MDTQESSVLVPIRKDITLGVFESDILLIKNKSDYSKAIAEAIHFPYITLKELHKFLKNAFTIIGKVDKFVKCSFSGLKLEFNGQVFSIFKGDSLFLTFGSDDNLFADLGNALKKVLPLVLRPNCKQVFILEDLKAWEEKDFEKYSVDFTLWKTNFTGKGDICQSFYFAKAHSELIKLWLFLIKCFNDDAMEETESEGE